MKRAVCIILSVLMTLMLLCPAFAVSFPDAGQISHVESVALLSDLGLISGYQDGSFRPHNRITREQIAKLMALFCTDCVTDCGGSPFSDVSGGWSLPYISYCAKRGLVSGSNGLYRPQDPVTAAELLKMLLCALGYDGTRYTGSSWRDAVLQDSQTLGLTDGFTADVSAPVSRQDASLLIANALMTDAISGFDKSGAPILALDALMNPQSYLTLRFGVMRYSGVLVANEHCDLQNGGKLPTGTSRLLGHSDFCVSTPAELLGHRVSIFARDGFVYGLPTAEKTGTEAVFMSAAELSQVLSDTNYALTEDTGFFLDYEKADSGILKTQPNCKITVVDNDGDFAIDFVFLAR